MIASILRRGLLIALIVAAPFTGFGFVVQPLPLWADGSVRLQLRLGSTPSYSDGSTPNGTAIEAARAWNPFMKRVQLAWTSQAAGAATSQNAQNEVAFSASIFGYSFGRDVLAVALISSDEARRTEADVLLNEAFDWDSYRGPLRPAAVDVRRVLVHEFGHVLGLGHPDQAGESVESIMNAYIGEVETPTIDDLDGIGSLYGRGPGNPARPLSLNTATPYDRSVTEGGTAQFWIEVTAGSRPWTFQWRRNGVDIPGANAAIYERPAVTLADAGNYSVVVTNEAGGGVSRAATLTVVPATRPFFPGTDVLLEIPLGGVMAWHNVSAVGSGPMAYQWQKDGVDIPGASNAVFAFEDAKAHHAGVYRLKATNVAGTALSPAFKVMVLPVPRPPEARADINYFAAHAGQDFATLDVAAPEVGTYTYQWYRNGLPIPGATRDILPILPSSGPADYHATITHRGGTTASLSVSYVPRRSAAADAGWLAVERHGNLAYFLFATPTARIERYDLVNDDWLAPIQLGRTPRTFAVDASGIYVAFDAALSRFDLAGKNEVASPAVDSPVERILLADGVVLVFGRVETDYGSASRFMTLRAVDLALVGATIERSGIPAAASLSLHKGKRWIFGQDTRSAPAHLLRAEFDANGVVAPGFVRPFFPGREYPTPERTFLSHNGDFVITDAGVVFRTSDLAYAGSFDRRFADAVTLSDGTYLTVGFGEMRLHDARFNVIRRQAVPYDSARVFVVNGTAVAFAPPPSPGAAVSRTRAKLADFGAPLAGPVSDPVIAAYTPSAVVQDARGVVYLLARSQRAVFRWSPTTGRHLEPWPLTGVANHLTYSPSGDKLFLAYADGRLTQIAASGAGLEVPVTTMPAPVVELVAAGTRLLVSDGYGANAFDTSGRLVAPERYNYPGDDYVFDGIFQRLFYIDNESPPSFRTLNKDGTLGPPAHATWTRRDRATRVPLRISPDGTSLGFVSGEMFAADTLVQTHSLPHSAGDLTWLGAQLYTARDSLDGIVVEKWNELSLAQTASRVVAGRLVRLLSLPDGRLLLIASRDGVPTFLLLDGELKGVEPVGPPFTSEPTSVAQTLGGSATFTASAGGNATFWWSRDGLVLPGRHGATSVFGSIDPADAGIYNATISTAAGGAASRAAILGVISNTKVAGAAAQVSADVLHPNGNRYDQVLMQGDAASIKADPGEVTRTSFVDLNGDIVQVEFSGAGTLSLVLAGASGPRAPEYYHQPAVNYMKGHMGLVIADADETTNVSVFSVGRATAFDPTGQFNIAQPVSPANEPYNNGSPLFEGHGRTEYDGIADLAYIAILSRNGRFGGVRAANARFSAMSGSTGVLAPGVQFAGPVFIGDLQAHDSARPVLLLGASTDMRVAGGNLSQPNDRAIQVSGIAQLVLTAGMTSHGHRLPAQTNQAVLERDGVDVTAQLVVNPPP